MTRSPVWNTHYTNACGQLDGLIEPVETAIFNARERVEAVLPQISLDIVVQAQPGRVIEEIGFVGHAPAGNMIYLTLDPGNPNLGQNLGQPLQRTIAHELHHVHRWRGPGYGQSLGEALVSEGLAGQFCKQLYQCPPEIWESCLSAPELADCAEIAIADWSDAHYDHGRWFFGTGELPFWAGYSLGYALAGKIIQSHSNATAASLVNARAEDFAPALQGLAA